MNPGTWTLAASGRVGLRQNHLGDPGDGLEPVGIEALASPGTDAGVERTAQLPEALCREGSEHRHGGDSAEEAEDFPAVHVTRSSMARPSRPPIRSAVRA